MNRLLITLLALLTGLVAQVSPAAATARVGGQTEIGALAAQTGQLRRGAVLAGGIVREAVSRPRRIEASLAPSGPDPVLPRTVLIGIDRARE